VKPIYVRFGSFCSIRPSGLIGEARSERGDDLDLSLAPGFVPAGMGGTDGLVLTGYNNFDIIWRFCGIVPLGLDA
jgi:hypothetical protein